MRKPILQLWHDFTALIYPNLCLVCHQHSIPSSEIACIRCLYHLPKTNFHLESENAFTEHFWGRVAIEAGAALYFFNKGSRTQELIHQLKYKGKPEVGVKLGRWYGAILKEAPLFQNIDYIVPVPLHPTKEKKRGYNQSASFAQGLAESMELSWLKDGLKRTEYTETQTKKSRFERIKNVDHVFRVNQSHKLIGKHILLVDDVLTTGATLEACANQLLTLPDTKVSLITIAMAKN